MTASQQYYCARQIVPKCDVLLLIFDFLGRLNLDEVDREDRWEKIKNKTWRRGEKLMGETLKLGLLKCYEHLEWLFVS